MKYWYSHEQTWRKNRKLVLRRLLEGMGIRVAARIAGVRKNTVTKRM